SHRRSPSSLYAAPTPTTYHLSAGVEAASIARVSKLHSCGLHPLISRCPLMSVEEVSSNPIDTTYESNTAMADSHAMTEDTGPTPGAPAPENQDGSQNPNTTQVEEVEEDAYQAPKRKKTSKVWNDFKEVQVGKEKKLECIYCKTRYLVNKTSTTSHLGRHSKSCMRKPTNLAKGNQQQLSIGRTINNAESVNAIENFRYDQGKMRQIVAHWIIMTEKALSTVDHEMFTLMMKTANPLYKRITRAHTTTDVFSTYEIFKKKIVHLLKNVRRLSLTTDMWKSNQTIEYMVLTCHFVDKDWKLQKRILNFVGVPPPHSGILVADALLKCLVVWDVEKKVWSITVDNASYNDVAARHLKGTLTYRKRLSLGGDLFHVRCCAHIVNIMVQHGLKEIQDTIDCVRQSVKHIAASESRVIMFREIAKQLELSPKKLILDCSTRWNSAYQMISVALELKDKLYDLYNEYVAEFNEKSVENPSEDGIDNAASTPSASVSEKKNTGRAKLDSLVEIIQSSTPTIMKSELDTYLEEKLHIAKNKSEFSVIEWWKDNRENYKILSQMACDIMSIPITSVSSEAAFSTGGRVIDPSRASLGVKTVEALLCTQDWLRNHYSITNASKV
ncbi:Zinc finger BED domain-containing protein RICESLEEPER 2, partial [Linum perenne]